MSGDDYLRNLELFVIYASGNQPIPDEVREAAIKAVNEKVNSLQTRRGRPKQKDYRETESCAVMLRYLAGTLDEPLRASALAMLGLTEAPSYEEARAAVMESESVQDRRAERIMGEVRPYAYLLLRTLLVQHEQQTRPA